MNISELALDRETDCQIRLRLLAEIMTEAGKLSSAEWLLLARDEIEELREQLAELKHEVARTQTN